MNRTTRSRIARPKLQKGQTAEGEEFYYSKKPSTRRSDFVILKSKPIAAPRSVRLKKEK